MDDLNFDAVDADVAKEVAKKEETKKAIESGEMKEPKKKITDGWTKGPFIVGGIIALLMIVFCVYVMFIM